MTVLLKTIQRVATLTIVALGEFALTVKATVDGGNNIWS